MFTGIIQATGRLAERAETPSGVRLSIDPGGWDPGAQRGDSIAINGCCLTLCDRSGADLLFDVIPETLDRTTIGALEVGERVNLEASATPTTSLGGHVVQGHVDAIGRVSALEQAHEHRVRFVVDAEVMEAVVPKGSVTIEGVSLTIASVDVAASSFDVALIPTTLAETTLGALGVGQSVNIETDVLARTVVHWLRHYAKPGR